MHPMAMPHTAVLFGAVRAGAPWYVSKGRDNSKKTESPRAYPYTSGAPVGTSRGSPGLLTKRTPLVCLGYVYLGLPSSPQGNFSPGLPGAPEAAPPQGLPMELRSQEEARSPAPPCALGTRDSDQDLGCALCVAHRPRIVVWAYY